MNKAQKKSDKSLLLKAADDQDALAQLVARYRTPLFNFACRFLADREAAEDVVQETFLRCLRNRHKFADIQHVSTWLYTITANLAKTELRRRKRWHWVPVANEEKEEEGSYYVPVDPGPLPDQRAQSSGVHQTVVEAIGKLPPEFREAVLLRDLNGLSYEEIANITNSPLGTVKSRVNRGRLRLHAKLRPLAQEVVGAKLA